MPRTLLVEITHSANKDVHTATICRYSGIRKVWRIIATRIYNQKTTVLIFQYSANIASHQNKMNQKINQKAKKCGVYSFYKINTISMWLIRATITEHTEPELSCSGCLITPFHGNLFLFTLQYVIQRGWEEISGRSYYTKLPGIASHKLTRWIIS